LDLEKTHQGFLGLVRKIYALSHLMCLRTCFWGLWEEKETLLNEEQPP
jgi:hypothetical protein